MFEVYSWDGDSNQYFKLDYNIFYDTYYCDSNKYTMLKKASYDNHMIKQGSIVKVSNVDDLLDLFSVLLRAYNFDFCVVDFIGNSLKNKSDLKNINDEIVGIFKDYYVYGLLDVNKYYKILEHHKPIYLYFSPYGLTRDGIIPLFFEDFDFLKKFNG